MFDAYSPKEIAARIEEIGVTKARLSTVQTLLLGVLAGGFIGLGGLFFTLVTSDRSLGFAASRVLGGAVFSLGLLLVVVAGAELFTGNNLLVMAWVSRRISTAELLRNWGLVFVGNTIGALGLILLVVAANHGSMNEGAVSAHAVRIGLTKTSMPLIEAFSKGVLCNMLVCLAVWMAMAGRSLVDKAVAVLFPISAFVAAGFEHSIANLYFIPLAAAWGADMTWKDVLWNLIPVTAGNIVGGSVLVGLVYRLIYRPTGQIPRIAENSPPLVPVPQESDRNSSCT